MAASSVVTRTPRVSPSLLAGIDTKRYPVAITVDDPTQEVMQSNLDSNQLLVAATHYLRKPPQDRSATQCETIETWLGILPFFRRMTREALRCVSSCLMWERQRCGSLVKRNFVDTKFIYILRGELSRVLEIGESSGEETQCNELENHEGPVILTQHDTLLQGRPVTVAEDETRDCGGCPPPDWTFQQCERFTAAFPLTVEPAYIKKHFEWQCTDLTEYLYLDLKDYEAAVLFEKNQCLQKRLNFLWQYLPKEIKEKVARVNLKPLFSQLRCSVHHRGHVLLNSGKVSTFVAVTYSGLVETQLTRPGHSHGSGQQVVSPGRQHSNLLSPGTWLGLRSMGGHKELYKSVVSSDRIELLHIPTTQFLEACKRLPVAVIDSFREMSARMDWLKMRKVDPDAIPSTQNTKEGARQKASKSGAVTERIARNHVEETRKPDSVGKSIDSTRRVHMPTYRTARHTHRPTSSRERESTNANVNSMLSRGNVYMGQSDTDKPDRLSEDKLVLRNLAIMMNQRTVKETYSQKVHHNVVRPGSAHVDSRHFGNQKSCIDKHDQTEVRRPGVQHQQSTSTTHGVLHINVDTEENNSGSEPEETAAPTEYSTPPQVKGLISTSQELWLSCVDASVEHFCSNNASNNASNDASNIGPKNLPQPVARRPANRRPLRLPFAGDAVHLSINKAPELPQCNDFTESETNDISQPLRPNLPTAPITHSFFQDPSDPPAQDKPSSEKVDVELLNKGGTSLSPVPSLCYSSRVATPATTAPPTSCSPYSSRNSRNMTPSSVPSRTGLSSLSMFSASAMTARSHDNARHCLTPTPALYTPRCRSDSHGQRSTAVSRHSNRQKTKMIEAVPPPVADITQQISVLEGPWHLNTRPEIGKAEGQQQPCKTLSPYLQYLKRLVESFSSSSSVSTPPCAHEVLQSEEDGHERTPSPADTVDQQSLQSSSHPTDDTTVSHDKQHDKGLSLPAFLVVSTQGSTGNWELGVRDTMDILLCVVALLVLMSLSCPVISSIHLHGNVTGWCAV
eukprot:GHVQ01001007.1.p1 GENE.GHVQ01001007.1~~GHVQ01001007.1.p1  ORF type:complete len:1020 (+),score=145.20 GHVQ01001007.1:322-3381(+)